MIFMTIMFFQQEAGNFHHRGSYQGKQLLNFCTTYLRCVYGCYRVTRDMTASILLYISIPCPCLALATLSTSSPALTIQ